MNDRSRRGRVTGRLALRLVRAAPGRTVLVAALIALPVLGVSSFSVLFASTQPTLAERLDTELGGAQAALQIEAPRDVGLVQSPTDPHDWTAEGWSDAPDEDYVEHIADVTPSGWRIAHVDTTRATVSTGAATAVMEAVVGDAMDAQLEGRFLLVDGRRPTADDDIMLSPGALARLGVRLGATITVASPTERSYRVVGVLQSSHAGTAEEQIFLPPSASAGGDDQPWSTEDFVLGNTPVTWSDVRSLNADGITVLSRAVATDPPADPVPAADINPWGYLLAAIVLVFGLLQVGLLAASAFLVGARQHQRSFAILASVGADRRTVRRVVSLHGVAVGSIGAVGGALLGIPGGAAVMALTRDGSRAQFPGFHVSWWQLGAIALIAILAAWGAAIVPARASSRLDIIGSLRGLARPPRPQRRTPAIALVFFFLGLASTAAGLIWLAAISPLRGSGSQADSDAYHALIGPAITLLAAGPGVALVAAVIVAPLILRAVARALGRAQVGVRLAARDAARNPSRSVPAIAVVMSTVFLSVLLVGFIAGGQQSLDDRYQASLAPDEVAVDLVTSDGDSSTLLDAQPYVDALTTSFDTSSVRVLSSARSSGDPSVTPVPALNPATLCAWDIRSDHYDQNASTTTCQQPYFIDSYRSVEWMEKIWVGDVDDLAVILGAPVSASALSVLDSGGVVTAFPHFVTDGTATIDWWDTSDADFGWSGGRPARSETLPATVQSTDRPGEFAVFMLPQTAQDLGIPTDPTRVVASTRTPPTTAQQDAAQQAVSAIDPVADPGVTVERGPDRFGGWQWAVLAVSAVIMIAASSVAIGLGRSDGRRDDAILGAVGASPKLRRSFGFWQTLVLCLSGTILGAILGFAEYAALAAGDAIGGGIGIGVAFTVPWAPLLAIALGVPLTIAIGAWITARPGRTHVMDRSAIA